jgi:hypothetical protein
MNIAMRLTSAGAFDYTVPESACYSLYPIGLFYEFERPAVLGEGSLRVKWEHFVFQIE